MTNGTGRGPGGWMDGWTAFAFVCARGSVRVCARVCVGGAAVPLLQEVLKLACPCVFRWLVM